MKRALVPLARGFEETEAIAVVDLLRRAEVEVVVAALEPGPVRSAHGVVIEPDALLADVVDEPFDAVVLPGGLEGTERLAASQLVGRALRSAASRGAVTAAVCAAPTVLELHGLLAGRRATCHGSRAADLGSAIFVDRPVVVDGTVVTSRGAGTALLFGLELVAALVGRETADRIAAAIHLLV
jgi:4-methyl-5(b-hydroxyethyl)-thiazole monophosphate biosynthesis